ncbi:MAG: carboxypeptidase-like regulatory domain-containing protein, partial [Candidatus Cloacimonadaceae bacterium]|nr:carboxypeptidase-like regulatory domain-containing protein [Candidatus Cloacimonadaceae bacterium]
QIVFTGYHNGKPKGKLGLLYFDDFDWGSDVLGSGVLFGGNIMFTELEVFCPPHPIPMGAFSLQVMNDLAEPVASAEIQLGDMTLYTDEAGMLDIPALGYSTWDLSIAKYGYYAHDEVIEIFENQTLIMTVTLIPLPPVTMTGLVMANDIPSTGFQGVSVILSSPYYHETSTNHNGNFALQNLRVGTTYSLTFQAEGYHPAQHTGLVVEHNFQVPVITMIEMVMAPQEVSATLVSPSEVLITWDSLVPVDLNSASRSKQKSATGDRYVTGYRIYLIPEAALNAPTNWVLLYSGALDQNQYPYDQWLSLASGTYYWGVKRSYNTGDISPAGISNPLIRPSAVDDDLLPHFETGILSISPNPFNPET